MTRFARLLLGLLLVAGLAGAAALVRAADHPAPAAPAAAAPAPGQQVAQTLDKEGVTPLKYWLYLPPDHGKSKEKTPLVLFMHGAGERGDNLDKVKVHGPPKLVAQGKAFPFILISPQCPTKAWWTSEVPALKALLDDVAARFNVDPDRVYVTGLSMGGFGTWALALDQPKRFAALAPICGRGDPSKVAVLKDVPIWVFHGGKDTTVPLSCSEEMVNALKAAGGQPKFTVYPDAGHDSWTETYNNPEFYTWMLAQKRGK
jgi:predicted peptidase